MSVERVDAIRERHTREHDPSNGPPYCRQCSHTAQAWVKWPCDAAALADVLVQVEAERDALRDVIGVLIRMAEDSGRRTSLDDALAMFGLSRETLALRAADSGTPEEHA